MLDNTIALALQLNILMGQTKNLPPNKYSIMHIYKCRKNCHIRIYPFWVGDEGEKCPRCGEWLIYKGDKNEEQLRQMQQDSSKNLVKSKKNLKRKKK